MSSSVDQIKSKLDIVSVLGTYIKLEKSGSNFKGRCPFHNEKTPSFFVSTDRDSYYCFGCHAKGDIFTFVQEFEGLDFVGALKVLAERAGVTLEAVSPQSKTEKDEMYKVLELATFYFEKNLSNEKIPFDYLLHRGLTADTVSTWKLGYAYPEWRGLYEFLLSKDIKPVLMERVGLIKKKEGTTDSFYDTFRGRIIFPIFDSSGRVVGFSGRILVDDGKSPKYLNSPETELFNKSEVLYGLHKAKHSIRERDYSILVEGQMDLVMLHQAGFTNTIASSGTALTEGHLIRLARLSNRIIMAFDGDSAGITAVSRASKIALTLGMEVKVAKMPEGLDPADLAKDSPEILTTSVKQANHVILFILDILLGSTNDRQIIARKIVSDVLPFVAYIKSSSEQAHFIAEISTRSRIKEEALWGDLRQVTLTTSGVVKQDVSRNTKVQTDRRFVVARKIIGIMLWQKHAKEPVLVHEDLEKDLIRILGPDFDVFMDRIKIDSEGLLFETESYYNNRDTLSIDVSELLVTLEEEDLKGKLINRMAELHLAESLHDVDKAHEILTECQRLSKRINELKQIHEKK
ncbi:MAG: DNA primase [Minisyncoccota bacterium]